MFAKKQSEVGMLVDLGGSIGELKANAAMAEKLADAYARGFKEGFAEGRTERQPWRGRNKR